MRTPPTGVQVVQDFSLLAFLPLAIEDKDSVQALVAALDKATGYVFKGLQEHHPYPELAYAASTLPTPDISGHSLRPQQQLQDGQEHGCQAGVVDTIREH